MKYKYKYKYKYNATTGKMPNEVADKKMPIKIWLSYVSKIQQPN
jgi:hypothetical protein